MSTQTLTSACSDQDTTLIVAIPKKHAVKCKLSSATGDDHLTTSTTTKPMAAENVTQRTALPIHVTPSGTPTPATVAASAPALPKRGHSRSASLEYANSFISKNILGLPPVAIAPDATQCSTLKSRNEPKRMLNKFGSHNNLEEYVQQGRTKFNNIWQMFEFNKTKHAKDAATDKDTAPSASNNSPMMQSLPLTINATIDANILSRSPLPHAPVPRKPTPTKLAGSRSSLADINEHLITIEFAQQQQAKQRSANGHTQRDMETNEQDGKLLRPVSFKPIPFEPDFSIVSNRFSDATAAVSARSTMTDRYGSTPSLTPTSGTNLRFGSTTDLRNDGGGGNNGSYDGACNRGASMISSYLSSTYKDSRMARRRGSWSLKVNDSMESIRHTPDSDIFSQNSNLKSMNAVVGCGPTVSKSKYVISGSHGQCDMTPSPSDSGVSDLEAALKDRDSELSYLRQTMEHNEKDKETFWENEAKRLKIFYEGQQRDYVLNMKKMEQMLAMQQFQFRQQKLRHLHQINQYREQAADLKSELEILRSNNGNLRNLERNLKDRSAYFEEQLRETQNSVTQLCSQLEESEWKVCERNGEIALLKSQLKEATMEEHQQQVKNILETETDMRQLNKIIILKDKVIFALTNELAKVRKELSDLAIFHEYGEEPSGKYTRLKQQLDKLTDICNKTRKHIHHSDARTTPCSVKKVLDDCNLEVIMNCLKIAPPLDIIEHEKAGEKNDLDSESDPELQKMNAKERITKVSSDIERFLYAQCQQTLPDVALSVQPGGKYRKTITVRSMEESTLDTLIEESANYAEEIRKLRKQLDDVRVNFELEKRQWSEERESVLYDQKQLQSHYISMYQKLRSLQRPQENVV